MARDITSLIDAQRALRSRFDDFLQALEIDDAAAIEIALLDFDRYLRHWTAAEERALIPPLERAGIEGRDPRRELRLEFVQLRELTGLIVTQISSGVRPSHLTGYAVNLDRRLTAHQQGLEAVYYPRAVTALTEEEWAVLLEAAPQL